MESLAGAEFEVTAAEDIYTADFQKDENGNRYKEYAKGEVVTTVKTDGDGQAVVENLPIGTYTVRNPCTKWIRIKYSFAGCRVCLCRPEYTCGFRKIRFCQ